MITREKYTCTSTIRTSILSGLCSVPFTPSHGPSSFAGTVPVAVNAPEASWVGNIWNSAKKFVFGSSSNEDDRKMPALDIPIDNIADPDFDMLNVSLGGGGFDSHDELSVIEAPQVHDDLPEPTTMVDHESLSSKKGHRPASSQVDLSGLMAEIELDLAEGPPELLTQLQSDMNDLVQESSVLINENQTDPREVEQRAAEKISRFVERVVRRNMGLKFRHRALSRIKLMKLKKFMLMAY